MLVEKELVLRIVDCSKLSVWLILRNYYKFENNDKLLDSVIVSELTSVIILKTQNKNLLVTSNVIWITGMFYGTELQYYLIFWSDNKYNGLKKNEYKSLNNIITGRQKWSLFTKCLLSLNLVNLHNIFKICEKT